MNIVLKLFATGFISCCPLIASHADAPVVRCQDLIDHTEEFTQTIYNVTDGVYVAVGYGLANAIMIEGEDGVVIIDTMESRESAEPVKRAFDEIAKGKPTKAIIYTHNHPDHTFGAKVFAGKDHPDIISHASTITELTNLLNVIQPIIYTRSLRQFGGLLPSNMHINSGIGPYIGYDRDNTMALLMPTKTFPGDRYELEIAGIKFVLIHAPGETDDQIFVWLPDKKVLFPGDNIYRAFPNLYAIRGTSKRDVVKWVESLDKMRLLGAEHLVPSHTRPISGADTISHCLTNYRDAIQYVHDRTVYYMNRGLTPREIADKVHLPDHLKCDPFLQEYYGMVEWSVKSIFSGYLGWFSGRASELFPLSEKEEAIRMADLVGGISGLVSHASEAHNKGDHQWAAQLIEHALTLDPANDEAKKLKSEALIAIGKTKTSANARNYLFTEALETIGEIEVGTVNQANLPLPVIHAFPLHMLFSAMKVNINVDKCMDDDYIICLYLTDIDHAYQMHLRHGVLEIRDGISAFPDAMVETGSIYWKELITGVTHLPPEGEPLDHLIQIEGNEETVRHFLTLFFS